VAAARPCYGLGDGLPAEAEAEAGADAAGLPDPLPDGLGPAEELARGLGVGDGKRVLGTFPTESAKIRTMITSTITTHGRARESFRGGSAPR